MNLEQFDWSLDTSTARYRLLKNFFLLHLQTLEATKNGASQNVKD